MFGLGIQEILAILIVALLVFGAARLPEIGRSLGRALAEFKKATQGDKSDGDAEKKK